MSFYSSVSNAGKTSMIFDKVYPNRKLMEENCQNDGVFVGRCILIEYDDNTFTYVSGYTPVRPAAGDSGYTLYADTTKKHPFVFKAQTPEEEGYVLQEGSLVRAKLIDSLGNIASTSIFFFVYEKDPETGEMSFRYLQESKEYLTDYDLNYNIDEQYAKNIAQQYAKDHPHSHIDVEKYKNQIFQSGWDSTIWQKVVEQGTIKYKMIASLNSDLPTFNVQGLAPHTEPVAPFFSPTSTNINYTLLTPTMWGFKVKNADDDEELLSDEEVVYYKNKDTSDDDDEDEKIRARKDDDDDDEDDDEDDKENTDSKKEDLEGVPYNGAIYYNKAGFDKLKRSVSNVENKISMTPTGYSTSDPQYYDEKGKESNLVSKPDMQELVIQLPAIGNAVSELWDLMYGEKDSTGKYYASRNDNIEWNDTTGLRMIKEDLDAGGFQYNENKSESVAGVINSLHDLMGMIIVPPTENQTKEEALDMAVANKIYFGAFGENENQKGFYYKDTEYKFVPFKDIPDLNAKYEAEGKPLPFPGFNEEEFVGSRIYYELNQFLPNKYYTYVDNNFYLDVNNIPTQDTAYYELGTPQEVALKEWHGESVPEDDDGKNPSTPPEPSENIVYYKDDEHNYINDTSEFADENKNYFMLTVTQETFPVRTAEIKPTYIWNSNIDDSKNFCPNNPDLENGLDYSELFDPEQIDITEIEIKVFKDGLFFETYRDVNGVVRPENLIKVKSGEKFEPNKSYYKVPMYAVINRKGNESEEDFVPVYYFIRKDGQIVSFEDVAKQEEGVNFSYDDYKVAFKEFEINKFYFASEFTIGEGEAAKVEKGYKVLAVEEMINNETIYYSIIATPTTGNGYVNEAPPVIEDPDNDDEEIPSEPTLPEEPIPDVIKTHYYKPGIYYIKNSTNDYILSNSLTMRPDQAYYILTYPGEENRPLEKDPETGLFKLTPVEGKFYEPNKYYYFSKEFKSNLMDTGTQMKEPNHYDVHRDYLGPDSEGVKRLVYFIPQEAYVVEDTAGFLSKGMVWDKASTPPSTVVLGGRYEEPKWTELKGFGRNLNTVNGLILHLNKYFRFEDKYARDKTTIQGCLNKLNDTLNMIDNVNPGNIMVIDDYGRISGGMVVPDGEVEDYLSALGPADDELTNEKRQEIRDKLANSKGWITPIIDTKAKNTSLLLAHTLPEVADDELEDIGGLKVDKNGHVRGAGSITVESLNSTVDQLSGKIDKLNGDASTAGSVANTATSVAAAEVAKIVANANASYDTLKEIADWILNDTTGAANMANDIAALEELVGDTAVATQISTAIDTALKAGNVDKYALASELTNTNARVKTLEDTVTAEKVAQWNSAEANVQPDWNATDVTSDAFILNKPDLSNYITNSQEFTYAYNDSVTNMTIQELLTYIAGLEARIKVLEDAASTPTA